MRTRSTRRTMLATPLVTLAVAAAGTSPGGAGCRHGGRLALQQRWAADPIGQVDLRYLRAERFSVTPER